MSTDRRCATAGGGDEADGERASSVTRSRTARGRRSEDGMEGGLPSGAVEGWRDGWMDDGAVGCSARQDSGWGLAWSGGLCGGRDVSSARPGLEALFSGRPAGAYEHLRIPTLSGEATGYCTTPGTQVPSVSWLIDHDNGPQPHLGRLAVGCRCRIYSYGYCRGGGRPEAFGGGLGTAARGRDSHWVLEFDSWRIHPRQTQPWKFWTSASSGLVQQSVAFLGAGFAWALR